MAFSSCLKKTQAEDIPPIGSINFFSKPLPTNAILSRVVLLLVLLFASTTNGSTSEWTEISTAGHFQATFETLSLPDGEQMGLTGITFQYRTGDRFSIGPGFYGAMTGERGGFITLGLDASFNKDINDWFSLSTGLFIGAGGGHGGHYLSGGGLMLRPHVGATFHLTKKINIGVGISHVEFPDGVISSTQPYFSAEFPFEILIDKNWSGTPLISGDSTTHHPSSEREFSLVYKHYRVPSDVQTATGRDQNETIGVVGARWDAYIDESAFLTIGTQGAMQGESNGFMQVLLGGGYRLSLTESTHLKLSAEVGFGGGGGVDTGGGFLISGDLAIQQQITDSLYLAASGGYINAPDGSFDAVSAGLQIGARYGVPASSRGNLGTGELAAYNRKLFRIRFAHQTYLKGSDNWRTHHNDEDIDNLGFQIDYFPNRTVYFTGQGLAAYGRGNAGAYMTGLLGAGIHYPLGKTPVFVDLEALAGAAGGGGVAVGGGFVWQANAGIGIELTDAFSLIATVGHLDAPGGEFGANVLGASIGYRFTMFGKK